jgi:hypothetical protein
MTTSTDWSEDAPGFMLEGVPGNPNTPHEFTVPVLLNTAAVSLLVNLHCQGLLATDGADMIVSVQISRVVDFTVEVFEKFEQASTFPSLCSAQAS